MIEMGRETKTLVPKRWVHLNSHRSTQRGAKVFYRFAQDFSHMKKHRCFFDFCEVNLSNTGRMVVVESSIK